MINNVDMNGFLTQSPLNDTKKTGAVQLSQQFSKELGIAMNNLNDQQLQVNQLNQDYVSGKMNNVHELMIATQKSILGLDLAVQVRNKVIDAYQTIMRMQV